MLQIIHISWITMLITIITIKFLIMHSIQSLMKFDQFAVAMGDGLLYKPENRDIIKNISNFYFITVGGRKNDTN